MAEVSGIFPNMVGAIEPSGVKTATEINTKTQGQMTRHAMIVDTINQDLIIPNVEKRIVGRVRSVLREQNT